MFDWIKKTSSTGLLDSSRSRSSRKLLDAVSRMSSMEDSLDTTVDFDESIVTRKSSRSFHEGRRKLSKKISSVFRRRPRLATLEAGQVKSESTNSLIEDDKDVIFDEDESQDSILPSPISEIGTHRRRKSLRRVLRADSKRKLFKRKPLDEYAKRKLQISRGSCQADKFCSLPSLASTVNETPDDSGYITSSPLAKAESPREKEEAAQICGKLGILVSKARTALLDAFERRLPQDKLSSSSGESRESLEDSSLNESASASLLRDSGIYESRNASISSDIEDDCLERTCAIGQDLIRQQPRLCQSQPDTRNCGDCTLDHVHHKELLQEFRKSTSCVEYNHTSTPLKNAPLMMRVDCSRNKETDREVIDRAVGIVNPALDICWNSTFLNHGFTGDEDFWNAKKPYMSKSAVDLMRDDDSDSYSEIAEFSSLYDLSCRTCVVQEATMDSGIRLPFWEECIEENSVDSEPDDRLALMPFSYDEDSGREASLGSSDGSYVITMYV